MSLVRIFHYLCPKLMNSLMSYRAHSRAWSTSHPSPKFERGSKTKGKVYISYQMKVIARMENSKA